MLFLSELKEQTKNWKSDGNKYGQKKSNGTKEDQKKGSGTKEGQKKGSGTKAGLTQTSGNTKESQRCKISDQREHHNQQSHLLKRSRV